MNKYVGIVVLLLACVVELASCQDLASIIVPSVIFGLACILVATLVTLATYWAYVQKHDDHSESRMRRRRLAVDDLDDDLYDGYVAEERKSETQLPPLSNSASRSSRREEKEDVENSSLADLADETEQAAIHVTRVEYVTREMTHVNEEAEVSHTPEPSSPLASFTKHLIVVQLPSPPQQDTDDDEELAPYELIGIVREARQTDSQQQLASYSTAPSNSAYKEVLEAVREMIRAERADQNTRDQLKVVIKRIENNNTSENTSEINNNNNNNKSEERVRQRDDEIVKPIKEMIQNIKDIIQPLKENLQQQQQQQQQQQRQPQEPTRRTSRNRSTETDSEFEFQSSDTSAAAAVSSSSELAAKTKFSRYAAPTTATKKKQQQAQQAKLSRRQAEADASRALGSQAELRMIGKSGGKKSDVKKIYQSNQYSIFEELHDDDNN